jgi:hypothetical protein
MPDPGEKMMLLAERLLDRTNRGEVSWTVSPKWAGTVFEAEAGGQLMTIRARDDDGHHPFQFTLWQSETPDPFGPPALRQVEAISSVEVPGEGGAEILAQLYQSARSYALKIDESIDAALAALDQEPQAEH